MLYLDTSLALQLKSYIYPRTVSMAQGLICGRRRKWAQGKDGLFGWRYCKNWYFTCTDVRKKTTTQDSHPPTQKPTFLILRDSGDKNASDKKSSRGKLKTNPNQVTAETGSSKKF